MLKDPLTLYKLIVLYMLDRVSFPLTKSQISDFILEKEYTNFMTLQQIITELTETGLIAAHTIGSRTHLSLTEEGRETLRYFENRINNNIKAELNAYFKEHEFTLRNEVSILADYYRATTGEYEAHLVAKDRDIKLVELTLSVPTEDNAAAICDNWLDKNQPIYQFLIKELF